MISDLHVESAQLQWCAGSHYIYEWKELPHSGFVISALRCCVAMLYW